MKILFYLSFCFSLALISSTCFSQDESFIREFFSKFKTEPKDASRFIKEMSFKGKTYFYDLDGNGIEEGIQKEIRDGVMYLNFITGFGRVFKSLRFDPFGAMPELYKIRIHRLSKEKRLLVFYMYDGYIDANEFYGMTTLYFGIVPNEKLEKMKFRKGPRVWLEKEDNIRYVQRIHKIQVEDLDNDGVKEVIVSRGGTPISRVIKFN